jgi:protocatechuate 3,4-dioxygenase beta subunit
VILERHGTSYQALSSSEGRYEFHVQPGEYRLHVDVPEGLYATTGFVGGRPIRVPDARACVEADVAVRPDGRIRGRVVDSGGNPVPGISVDLLSRTPYGQYQRTVPAVATGDDGTYEFTRVDPGTYLVGIDTLERDSAGRQQVRVLLPGVLRDVEAQSIELGESQRARVGDLVMPAFTTVVTLTGSVRDDKGITVPRARVFARSDISPIWYSSAPVVTDEEGRFRMSVISGRRYRLNAEIGQPGIDFRHGEIPAFDITSDWNGLVIEIGRNDRR